MFDILWIIFLIALVFLGFWILFVLGYILVAYLLKHVHLNKRYNPFHYENNIPIIVFSNGIHTDIAVPMQNELIHWGEFINMSYFKPANPNWIAFGWGDTGFYLDTPTWAELKASTALKALFHLGSTVMHVILYEESPQDKWTAHLNISREQYQKLIEVIQEKFARDDQNQIIPIDFKGLPAYEGLNDKFYIANGRYNFFNTCNTWVTKVLLNAGVKTAPWTPFAKDVFHHLQKNKEKE